MPSSKNVVKLRDDAELFRVIEEKKKRALLGFFKKDDELNTRVKYLLYRFYEGSEKLEEKRREGKDKKFIRKRRKRIVKAIVDTVNSDGFIDEILENAREEAARSSTGE